MKPSLIIPCLAFCLITLNAVAEDNPTPAAPTNIVKRPTHKDLVKVQQEQEKEKHKRNASRPVTKKPIVTIKKRSIIGSSTLLSSGVHWTLVPRGAVVYVPDHLKGKIVAKPSGTLISWKKFLHKNYGWLHIHPVKMTQAQGKEKISQKSIKAYKSMGKIVVATCAQGPISVAPDSLKPPVDEKAEAKKK